MGAWALRWVPRIHQTYVSGLLDGFRAYTTHVSLVGNKDPTMKGIKSPSTPDSKLPFEQIERN